ncbi:Pls/PosA family non-ribosomal peptide synthetase [Ornithinimicrobium sp. W1679]|uniref:Pls/PosA family non-ribosomal peptide synthetase n=1 Tax=unclassified Ornithinimicrobium TaxID=2615080 RepID=UPI003CE7BE29
MHHYFEASCDRCPDAVALEWEGGRSTYAELDADANRLAHHLVALGVRPGGRVGLMVPRSRDLYVALLGVQKAGAAWVPVDTDSPPDRVRFVTEDAAVVLMVTVEDLADRLAGSPVPVLCVDGVAERLAVLDRPAGRPEITVDGDPTAYVIYTSGSSGTPKGVDVAQSSICNFIHVITEVYDVRASDRVYQGMTISFDFAIEEVWPTWAAGATLVAGPTDGRRVGAGLTAFLEDHHITLLYCVPTVLSTVERTVPSIRGLLVGGEACPAELVERWAPGRWMLNTYGPTEATVTCVWSVLLPGRPVTIGVPVPTYTAVILDEDLQPVPEGEVGELCVGGPGVARGYLNRPELTAERFIKDPTDPGGGRIYRTGDLARVQEDGEIVYLGRADAEVKIRGHRVDLGEIESVIMRDEDVPSAAVRPLRSEVGDDLAGYLVLPGATDARAAQQVITRVHQALRASLPPYMVPSYLEQVDELPMLPSGKVDRPALPEPRTGRLVGGDGDLVPPATPTERWVQEVWAETFRLDPEQLSVTANFFGDLAGHSLLAATVTSRLRTDPRGASMSVIDLYASPTVRELATRLDAGLLVRQDGQVEEADPQRRSARRRLASSLQVATFGAVQLACIFALLTLTFLPVSLIYWWHGGVPSSAMVRQLALLFAFVYLGERWLLPLVVARVVGRGLVEGTHPLYGWTHLRVWIVAKAMSLSPLGNLAGSAFAPAYLRAAGARIGAECHLGSAQVALPGLVELQDRVTVGYATHLQGYDVRGGRLHLGRVRLGTGSTVAANCVLVGPCAVGPRTVLREQSSLRPGQSTGEAEAWQGSPSVRLSSVGDPVFEVMAGCEHAPRTWAPPLRARFALGLVALELTPLVALLPVVALVWWTLLSGPEIWALVVTAATGPVFVVTACLLILALRRFGLPQAPVGIHHLRSRLGVEKWFADKLLEASLLLTNSLYSTLYTAPWLRQLGAHIGPRAEVSTIANIDPDLLTIGEESFVADMASVGSATYCNGHVAFRTTTVGRRSFVGNAAFVPSGTHLGDDSLIGVGSVPPAAGVPAGSSWLGNPPIFLPRRELYENFGDEQTYRPPRRKVVARYLVEAVRITLPASLLAVSLFATLHLASIAAGAGAPWWLVAITVPGAALLSGLGVVILVALLKWALVGRYRPRVEPLWSSFVRRTELVTGVYETAAVPALLTLLTGTPMLGPLLRLYGVHVGRRTLVETTYLTEFDLVRIGDESVVGPDVSLQTHLFEDRVMKMGTVELGRRTDLGTRAVVLYDAHVGEEAQLAPLSLVMKGESLPAATRWAGIPAQPFGRTGSPP